MGIERWQMQDVEKVKGANCLWSDMFSSSRTLGGGMNHPYCKCIHNQRLMVRFSSLMSHSNCRDAMFNHLDYAQTLGAMLKQ